MYNLLVSGNPDAWQDGTAYDFDLDRCVKSNEFTDAAIAKKYGELDDVAIAELLKFPALFAYETGCNKPARLGWLKRVRVRQGLARFDFQFHPSGASLSPQQILSLRWDSDVSDWEMNRHHWAVKDVDLFEALAEKGLIDLKILARQSGSSGEKPLEHLEIHPRIFRRPMAPPDASLVSVMMPYAGFDSVYEAISRSVKAVGLRCQRADKFWEESELIQDIFSLIYRSHFVICDFIGNNPNVFYEAGIAHTLGRIVIPIAQNAADVPFDLRHHRYIPYLNNKEGLEELIARLSQRLDFLKKRGD